MTPEERRAHLQALSTEASAIKQDIAPAHLRLAEIEGERVQLISHVSIDMLREAFPGIEIHEATFLRIEHKNPLATTPDVVRALREQNISPRIAVVDETRMEISFVK